MIGGPLRGLFSPDLQDFLPDDLGSILDLLHRLAGARASGFVSTGSLSDIVRDGFDKLLEALVILHVERSPIS